MRNEMFACSALCGSATGEYGLRLFFGGNYAVGLKKRNGQERNFLNRWNVVGHFVQVIAKSAIYPIVFILKPKNIQCERIEFLFVLDVENPMGIKLFHLGSKVPKNKKALW